MDCHGNVITANKKIAHVENEEEDSSKYINRY